MNLKAIRLLVLCKNLRSYRNDAIYGDCYENVDCDGEMDAELNQPARVAMNGTLYVFAIHGELHRTDGPAVIRILPGGDNIRLAWYLNDKLIKTEHIPFDSNRTDLYKD